MKISRFIPTMSIFSGILIILGGLSLIGFYIYAAFQSLDQSDKSLIFWYLPFVFFGLLLNAAGAYFIAIGKKARTEPDFFRLSRNSLIILGGVIILTLAYILIGENRADQTRNELQLQHQIRSDLHTIDEVRFENLTTNGFTLYISASGNLVGEYQIGINIFDSRDQLYQYADSFLLTTNESETEIGFLFDEIFHTCKNSNQPNLSYFCVDNAGTNNLELNISITLKPYKIEGIELPAGGVESSWSTSLLLDTFTRSGIVEVESVMPG